jgi:SPP1 gp7 family putative phage head morphogenesis protein
MDITSNAYRKAFENYLRKGISIELQLKAAADARPTPSYVWRTREDEKVRPSHAANDGVIFAWDAPPTTGHPGEDFGCRCTAEPYYGNLPAGTRLRRPDADEPIEAVYPEMLIIPLLRTPCLIEAWRAWLNARAREREQGIRDEVSRNWQLNPRKSEARWANRMEKGGWTPLDITRTIRYGRQVKVKIERTGGPATRYELDGKYLVKDDVTNDIVQLSGPKHQAKNFFE